MSTTEGTKTGWSALAKGAIGAAGVAFAGFLGTAAVQVLSAPMDTVAYDFIQSVTGMLKAPAAPQPASAPPPAKPAERTSAAGPSNPPATPQPAAPAASPAPQPTAKVGLPSAVDVPSGQKEASAKPDAPAGSMLDRVRQTAELADKTRRDTAAMLASRVLSLNDRAEAPICGSTYRLEVTSVEAGKGTVSLRGRNASDQPITLAVGAPRAVGSNCRVELLMAMEDLTNRRAQLRETMTR